MIVPVYNAADTLPACLAGMDAQIYHEGKVEWIFVENNSTDDSATILRASPRVHLLFEKKAGAYAARNTGAAAACGEILVFIDPDCVPHPYWIQSLVDAMRKPGILIALGVRRPAPDVGLNRLLGDYETTKDRWVLTSNEPEKYFAYTNNMAVACEAWNRFGPFLEQDRGSDTIFIRQVVDGAGCEVTAFVPMMQVSHLEVDGAATYFRKVFAYGRSMQSYRRIIPVRPLSLKNRIAIFRQTIQDNAFGPIKAMILAVLLAAGMAMWTLGRLSGQLFRK